ncbi:MAG: 16S rRNA (adenine(1518)-N(6)/adenine(1519)-N(6))-dimethyltransferase RsmA [Fervidicoccus fontis]
MERTNEHKVFFFSPIELKNWTIHFIKEAGIKPKKKLSQNFTIDPNYIETFIKELSLIDNLEWMVEIGTGIGTLTKAVSYAFSSSNIITIEKDASLFSIISSIIEERNVYLILADALGIVPSIKTSVVFSSTPFSITSPIIIKACRNNNIKNMILGMQKEVAERLVAATGSKSYGRLSILAQLLFEIRIVRSFTPKSFFPEPKVSVSIVSLKRMKNYDTKVHFLLEKLTSCVFSQRNKNSRKVFKQCLETLKLNCIDYIEKLLENKRVRELSPWEMEEISRRCAEVTER